MRPLYRVAIAALAFAGAAASAAAEPSPGVLNKLQVQKLVAAQTFEASIELADHFNALADRYVAEATRQRAMANAYAVNTRGSVSTNATVHWERQATEAARLAVTARELAMYHLELADGVEVMLPYGAQALQGGYGAPEPTAAELHEMALKARTRADHFLLEEYFAERAKQHHAAARDHAVMAQAYRVTVRNGTYDPAVMCDRLARAELREARKSSEAATRHRQLANVG